MGESLLLCCQAGGPRTPGTRLPAACGPYTASFARSSLKGQARRRGRPGQRRCPVRATRCRRAGSDGPTDPTSGPPGGPAGPGVAPPPAAGPRRYRYDLAGGAMMDAGCYAVHFLRTRPVDVDDESVMPSDTAVSRRAAGARDGWGAAGSRDLGGRHRRRKDGRAGRVIFVLRCGTDAAMTGLPKECSGRV